LVTFGVVSWRRCLPLGLLDARPARSGVAGMVVRLSDDPAPACVTHRAALRDDSLTVPLAAPVRQLAGADSGRSPCRAGWRPRRDHRGAARRPVAALLYRHCGAELVAAVGAAAAIAERPAGSASGRLQDLRGSRSRLLAAAQDERRRLGDLRRRAA
jgi:hypothetical protein